MSSNSFKAIPTVYQGVQFRSRLEAKWAAFFDLLGWKWEYEPFDLDGWIPDFLLTGRDVLVEVKPIDSFPADVAAEINHAIPEKYEALIVGHTFPLQAHWSYSIDPVSGEQIRKPFEVDPSLGFTVGFMLGRPRDWQPRIRPTWGLGLVQWFIAPNRNPPHYRYLPWDNAAGFDLYHSHDPSFICDPGEDPYEKKWSSGQKMDPRDVLADSANARGCFLMELQFFPHEDRLSDLWAQAANVSQWKGVQSQTDF